MHAKETNEVTVDMSTTNEVEPVKKAVKKTVKRKIDFNQNDEKVKNTRSNDSKAVRSGDTENNNTNATKTVRNVRTRTRAGFDNAKNETSSWVQWTQEFLDKVRKSNEKYKNIAQKKLNQKNSKVDNNRLIDAFQNTDESETRTEFGDCIQMMVDNADRDEEDDLLDYEDDLSIEDGDIEVTMSNTGPEVETDERVQPDPSTAGAEGAKGHDSAFQSFLAITEQVGAEEKLMQNPIM